MSNRARSRVPEKKSVTDLERVWCMTPPHGNRVSYNRNVFLQNYQLLDERVHMFTLSHSKKLPGERLFREPPHLSPCSRLQFGRPLAPPAPEGGRLPVRLYLRSASFHYTHLVGVTLGYIVASEEASKRNKHETPHWPSSRRKMQHKYLRPSARLSREKRQLALQQMSGSAVEFSRGSINSKFTHYLRPGTYGTPGEQTTVRMPCLK